MIPQYIRSNSKNKGGDLSFQRSQNWPDKREDSLQEELGTDKAYVLQEPNDRAPGMTLEVVNTSKGGNSASLGNSVVGVGPTATGVPLRERSEAQFKSFTTSENNLRKKFIDVNEFEKTPGEVIREAGEYGYPNKSTEAEW